MAATPATDVQHRVVGDVARSHGFAVGPGTGEHPGCHQGCVLQDFLCILATHEGNVVAGQFLFCKLIEPQTEGGFWFSMLR